MDKSIEDLLKEDNQNRLRLKNTKIAAKMYLNAIKEKMDTNLIHELWLAVVSAARHDWGQQTQVDDFSIEGKFIITNGKKEDTI